MVALRRNYYLEPAEFSSVVCIWLNSRIGVQGDLHVLLRVNPRVRRVHLASQVS